MANVYNLTKEGPVGNNGSVGDGNGSVSNSDGSVSDGVDKGSVDEGSGVDEGSVGNHGPVSHDGSVGNGGSGSVGRGAGVGHLGNVAAVSVSVVGHGLGPAVGQTYGVLAAGGVAITVLVLGKVGAGVVVVDAVLVGVHGGLVGVHGGGGGVLGQGGGHQGGEHNSNLYNTHIVTYIYILLRSNR